MAKVYDPLVKESSTTTGTGDFNLDGPTGIYQSFVNGVGDGNTCDYVITDGTDVEVGEGTVTDGTPDTLSRDTVYYSTNSDAKVNWGAGDKDVYITLAGPNIYVPGQSIQIDDGNSITDENGNEQVVFNTTASAVNYIDLTNAATAGSPTIAAAGSDTNIDLTLTAKGTGNVVVDSDSDIIVGDHGVEDSGILVNGITYNAKAKISGIADSNPALLIVHQHSTSIPGRIVVARSNSNTSSHAILTDGQVISSYYSVAHDGTDYNIASEIRSVVDGTPGANDMPTRMDLRVTADGANSPTTRLSIEPDGTLNVSGTTNYENLVTADDDIPNKKYIDDKYEQSGINFVIDGGGSAITTGVKGYIEVPFDCTITAVRLLADQSGSIVVDIWKDTYANYPPTDADSITSSSPPTISTATKDEDTILTSWTTSVSAGDILGFNVDSITTITRCTVSLTVDRV